MSIRQLCRSFRAGLTLSHAPGAIAPPPAPPTIPQGDIQPTTARYLPTAPSLVKVYTFPTPDKRAVELPTMKSLILDKSDPVKVNIRIEDPTKKPALIAGPRMLTIRRKKMKKHKRRKRYFRDLHKYQTYHRRKKAKAEHLFRQRMQEIIHELEQFDPLEHVRETIRQAKQEWQPVLADSGRRKYPHWSTLMAVEELYGLPNITHIDKRAGRPTPEDAKRIAQLRADYFKKYARVKRSKQAEE